MATRLSKQRRHKRWMGKVIYSTGTGVVTVDGGKIHRPDLRGYAHAGGMSEWIDVTVVA